MTKPLTIILAGLAILPLVLAGCGNQGPAEETGEDIDQAAEEMQEQAEEGTEEAMEAVEEAGDQVEEATDRSTQ
ncbi:MAG: hypothetical protein KFF45_05095 [Thioalkalivibrio sp.]|nr:hypothetical protein [Thioalkalivibrio sp.]